MRDMTLSDFAAWIAEDVSVIRLRAGATTASIEEFALAQTLKLAEEGGELAEQVLGHFGFQRAGKSHKFDEHKLALELADVTITIWELVAIMGGDLSRVVRESHSLETAASLQDAAAHFLGQPTRGAAIRLLALRRSVRLDKELGSLASAVEDHYNYFPSGGYPGGAEMVAMDTLHAIFPLADALGIDLVAAVLEKRDIILERGKQGDG